MGSDEFITISRGELADLIAAENDAARLERQRDAAIAERDDAIAERDELRDRVTAVLEAVRAQRDREAELAKTRFEEACCHEYAHTAYEEMVEALTQALEEGS